MSIYKNYNQIKLWILNRVIVERGILAPNCIWYKISDLFLNDGAGINLYNDYKEEYGDFAPSTMFNEKIYVVTNVKYIKQILDNSPDTFGVGKLKQQFFRSFMHKNVGVSSGCPWKRRREMNEKALLTDQLHVYSEKYNTDIQTYLHNKWKGKKKLMFNDFLEIGKYMTTKIVFNTDKIDPNIFQMFSEANTTELFSNPNFRIQPKIYQRYIQAINSHIDNPNVNSLVDLTNSITTNKEEVKHQIPHYIFPLVATFVSVIPRLLILLFNDNNVLQNVVDEINSIDPNQKLLTKKIYKLSYLRKCIMESLRLNNVVITTFRTLLHDYTFDEKYKFRKGTQFLILNNPVLREKEFFENPNEFNPERWTEDMEKSYYAISFNQGPQRCPGKELVIFLAQSFIYHFILSNDIHKIKVKKIDLTNVPQVINPCEIKIKLHHS
tara:strand:- start:1780 stop:3090 length:1311 start_codon:yes stop_codon:yes gene_type:complete